MQLKTIILTTSAPLGTHTLFILSLLICRMGTRDSNAESSTGSLEGLAHPPRALERMCEVLFPVCWAEGWQLGRINCNYLFISEIWPRSVSVRTVVWSGAQLGIKPPSAPWLQWTGRGGGGPSASQPPRPAALCCRLELVTLQKLQWWLKDQLVCLSLFAWGVERHFLQSICGQRLKEGHISF